jgi:hypothetical protein
MTARQTSTPAPVATPTAIWWLGDGDHSIRPGGGGVADAPVTATPPASRFLSRLSQRLVLTYTSRGDVVVDFHGDAYLRQATEQTGRAYVLVADRAAVADLDRRATPTSLIVIGRPSPAAGLTATTLDDLFLACRLMMTADVATLAVIGPADPDQRARLRRTERLRAAATPGGLHAAGGVIAVHQPGSADRFLFYADDEVAAGALSAGAPTVHPVMRIDLFTTAADDKRHV